MGNKNPLMKKLSPDQLKSIGILHRGNHSPVYRALMALEIGEVLQIEPADWPQKTPPNALIARINRKNERKLSIGKIIQGSKGWIVTRVS